MADEEAPVEEAATQAAEPPPPGLIVQDKGGATYGMSVEAFGKSEGYTAVSWEDGTPYKKGQSYSAATKAAAPEE